MARVWNRKAEQPPADAVYIGRGTKWGNPFGRHTGHSREEAINCFRFHLDQHPALKRAVIDELRGRDLVCSCKPQPCHGDVLLEIANVTDEALILQPFDPSKSASQDAMLAALQYASTEYYNGRSVVADTTYDALLVRFKALAPDHPFLAQVGAPPPEHRGEVQHIQHMGSQHHINGDDAMEQFKSWINARSGKVAVDLMWSHKLDGSSVSLTYQNGQLVRAVTRGDGNVGMDITQNARNWSSIPLRIPQKGLVAVRVEACLPLAVWREHFFDESEPTNARNVGNGIICRGSDPNNDNQHIIPYGLDLMVDGNIELKLSDTFDQLSRMGFETPPHGIVQGHQHAKHIFKQTLEERDKLPLMIDGIVYGVNDRAVAASTGHHTKTDDRPNWMVAVKFPTERKTTKLTNIALSIGHTGAIIPTAEFDSVHLAGTKVARALLNNFVYMQADLGGINVGDTVEIEKGGDIIPHITKVVERGPHGAYQVPTECPWCGSTLVQDGRRLLCVNDECEGKILKQASNWRAKAGIKELGESTLKTLIDNQIISRVPDIYRITEANLIGAVGGDDRAMGLKTAQKIMVEINKSRTMTADVFMSALGITNLGLSRAQATGYKTVNEWLNASESDLRAKLGEAIGSQVYHSIERKTGLIHELAELIEIRPYLPPEAHGDALKGKTFCFSTCRPTPEEKAFIEAQGGKIKSGVDKELTALVVKDPNKSTTKTKTAEKYNVKVIAYDKFQEWMQRWS